MMDRQTLLDKWVRKQPRFEMTPTDRHGNRESSARGGPSSSTDTRETVERAPGKRTLTGKVTATTRTRVNRRYSHPDTWPVFNIFDSHNESDNTSDNDREELQSSTRGKQTSTSDNSQGIARQQITNTTSKMMDEEKDIFFAMNGPTRITNDNNQGSAGVGKTREPQMNQVLLNQIINDNSDEFRCNTDGITKQTRSHQVDLITVEHRCRGDRSKNDKYPPATSEKRELECKHQRYISSCRCCFQPVLMGLYTCKHFTLFSRCHSCKNAYVPNIALPGVVTEKSVATRKVLPPTNTFTFIGANANRSRSSLDLILRAAKRERAVALVVSEPNIKRTLSPEWHTDEKRGVAILILSPAIGRCLRSGRGDGFIWMEFSDLIVAGCYLSPNAGISAMAESLDRLTVDLGPLNKKVLFMGDFNGRSEEWGDRLANQRGKTLSDWIASNNYVIQNVNSGPTFRNTRGGESVVDLAITNQQLAPSVLECTVLQDDYLSDHQPVRISVRTKGRSYIPPQNILPRWRVRDGDLEELSNFFQTQTTPSVVDPAECTALITDGCKSSLKVARPGCFRRPEYWWSTEISDLLATVNAQKRKWLHAKDRAGASPAELDYLETQWRSSRGELKAMIARSKAERWKDVLEAVEEDPWGEGYKIVTGKFQPIDPSTLPSKSEKLKIAEDLFPEGPSFEREIFDVAENDIPQFTEEELKTAISRVKGRKAPGPDGLPPEAVKLFVLKNIKICLAMFNVCLLSGIFPLLWKISKLLLLPKPRKTPDSPLSFRPICLINVLGKILERLIVVRLIQECPDLADNQFGFRPGRSTVDAIKHITDFARSNWRLKGHGTVLTMLDIKNAFNSAQWHLILEALRLRNVPPYLIRIIQSYFQDRYLIIEDEVRRLSCGVPQGSVLAPFLWIVLYDSVVEGALPMSSILSAYADDVAIATSERSAWAIGDRASAAVRYTVQRIEALKLIVEATKTAVVLLFCKRSDLNVTVKVKDTVHTPTKHEKYLGVWLDRGLNFSYHVKMTAAKTRRIAGFLVKIMPLQGGCSFRKRRVLASVTTSILTYAAPVWVHAMDVKVSAAKVIGAMRPVKIRICSAYRTVANEALDVLTDVPPADLLVRRVADRYNLCDTVRAQENLLQQWRQRWLENQKNTAKWTRILIPDLDVWCQRSFGYPNFFTTQLLTGHGAFGKYLFKLKLCDSPMCGHCGLIDSAEHVLFHCQRWGRARRDLFEVIGGQCLPGELIGTLLQDRKYWRAFERFAEIVLSEKRRNFTTRRFVVGPII